jgi:hypothetical protein
MTRLRREEGVTMIIALGVMVVTSLLLAGTFIGVDGDIVLTSKSTSQKKAYYAALAGINDYQFHLNANPEYWTTCEGASNVAVPNTTEETYSIVLVPAEGSGYSACSKTNANASMIQQTGSAAGTFRIESTGVSGGETQSIVATIKHEGFLNYVYFTEFETSDPVQYEHSSEYAGCDKHYEARKTWEEEEPQKKSGIHCNIISFGANDGVHGPIHTNDRAAICGEPIFGRNSEDKVEFNGGWYASCGGGKPDFLGTYTTEGKELRTPPTDKTLIASAGYTYSGRTEITLEANLAKPSEPNTFTVTNNKGETSAKQPWPSSGVIYVNNAEGTCNAYTPFGSNYTTDTACGNVYVHGDYTAPLTIGSANDVIINGNIETTHNLGEPSVETPTGTATLGLIAEDFVRVYKPVKKIKYETSGSTCETGTTKEGATKKCLYENNSTTCNAPTLTATEAETELHIKSGGVQSNPVIDAAILAVNHEFIVDNYECGPFLGYLNIWGAIGQEYRGIVWESNGNGEHGYDKDYNYDNRLHVLSPPHFINPVDSAWKVQREAAPPKGFVP